MYYVCLQNVNTSEQQQQHQHIGGEIVEPVFDILVGQLAKMSSELETEHAQAVTASRDATAEEQNEV